jgi:hypothetical protein
MYDDLLHEAGEVSDKAVDRVRRLCERFPSAVPGSELEQLQRARPDPWAERRRMVRLVGGQEPIEVRTDPPPARPAEAWLLDRSAGGLGLLLDRATEPGAVLGVLLPGAEGDWFFAQVRHCRPAGNGWVVGCEFLGDRPPA